SGVPVASPDPATVSLAEVDEHEATLAADGLDDVHAAAASPPNPTAATPATTSNRRRPVRRAAGVSVSVVSDM
ncbi:MAG: hypothetical protein ACLP2J_01190, partial [Acidimicrobiales bacterium]